MTTGAIIAIVVVALIIIALLAFLLPRMRARARVQKSERELTSRRDRVAGEQRAQAETREREATQAEQRARVAAKEAEAQRAQAELHAERAGMTERGMADDDLIEAHERDRFAGTSADRDGALSDGRDESDRDYQRGRADEARDEADVDRPARFRRDAGDTAAVSENETERPARS